MMMDQVVEAVNKVKNNWTETLLLTHEQIKAIEDCGKSGRPSEEIKSLPRFNRIAQDGISKLSTFQLKLDLLAPQLPSFDQVQDAQLMLDSWSDQLQSLRAGLRKANMQAKDIMKKAAQKERELLLGAGEESTVRRRNLQTKAGMTSAAESITESLRRTRQLMVQEVERSTNTLVTFEDSTGVLRKAESEYKGHRSLLMWTRNLLSMMKRQDVLDRMILVVGFFLFSCAVLYVVSKRMGILKLQRLATAAIKSGMAERAAGARVQVHGNQMPEVNLNHDEL